MRTLVIIIQTFLKHFFIGQEVFCLHLPLRVDWTLIVCLWLFQLQTSKGWWQLDIAEFFLTLLKIHAYIWFRVITTAIPKVKVCKLYKTCREWSRICFAWVNEWRPFRVSESQQKWNQQKLFNGSMAGNSISKRAINLPVFPEPLSPEINTHWSSRSSFIEW